MVDPFLEPGDQVQDSLPVRTFIAGRRHETPTQLAYRGFPRFRLIGNVVRGQRILRLVAVGEDCRHALGVRFPDLAAGEIYRVAAWAKLAPGERVMIEARDGFVGQTSKSSNYGLALFNLESAGVVEASGDILASGVEAEADGWLKLWVETRSKDGQAFVLAALIEGENNRHIFTAAGQQLTLGGWEIAPG